MSIEKTTEDFDHELAENVRNEIIANKKIIWQLIQHNEELHENLKLKCPHKYVSEEYDDDYHSPRTYNTCKLCGNRVSRK